jgi:hypothetical protein
MFRCHARLCREIHLRASWWRPAGRAARPAPATRVVLFSGGALGLQSVVRHRRSFRSGRWACGAIDRRLRCPHGHLACSQLVWSVAEWRAHRAGGNPIAAEALRQTCGVRDASCRAAAGHGAGRRVYFSDPFQCRSAPERGFGPYAVISVIGVGGIGGCGPRGVAEPPSAGGWEPVGWRAGTRARPAPVVAVPAHRRCRGDSE